MANENFTIYGTGAVFMKGMLWNTECDHLSFILELFLIKVYKSSF